METSTQENNDDGSRFAILLQKDEPVPVGQLEESVSAVFGIPLVEARLRIRQSRGVLFEELDRDQAETLKNALEQSGLQGRILTMDQVVSLPESRELRQLKIGSNTLELKLGIRNDQVAHLPRDRVDLVSAGVVGTQKFWAEATDSTVKNMPHLRDIEDPKLREELTNALSNRGLKKEVEDTRKLQEEDPERVPLDEMEELAELETNWVIDICCFSVPTRYRIYRKRMHYPGETGSGKAGTYSSENFLELLANLLRPGDLVCTPETLNLFTDPPLLEHIFEDMDRFHAYTRWFYSMLEMKHVPAPDPAPVLSNWRSSE